MQQPRVVHPQSMTGQPHQPLIVYQVVPSADIVFANYKSKAALILGCSQLILGIVCFILQTANFAGDSITLYLGTGYWCGLFFVLAGAFGIVSSKRRTYCWIVTFMVLSIIAAVLAATMTSVCSSMLAISYMITQYDESSHYYSRVELGRALDGVMVAVGVAELVLAICSSAICCASVCCKKYPQTPVHPSGQPQLVFLTEGAEHQSNVIHPSNIPQDQEMGALAKQPIDY